MDKTAHRGPPDVSIIIVNWNSCRLLLACLKSVFATCQELAIEVIVIDNASYDGSDEALCEAFPAVKFIQNDENVGFARANNIAVRYSTGRNLLFLNPDTEIIGDAIKRMVRFLDATPTAGAIGCRLLNTDGSLQTSCIQAFPTVLNQTLDSNLLRSMFPRSSLWGTKALHAANFAPAEVEALSGACLLVARTAFVAVGQFSPEYFMYTEDVDLCFKLHKASYKNYYLGDVCVVHHGGQSSGASSESQFGNILMRESKARFLRLHRGTYYAGAYRAALALAATARLLALVFARVVGVGLYKPGPVNSAMRKWSRVLRWTVGAESWVQNPVTMTRRQDGNASH